MDNVLITLIIGGTIAFSMYHLARASRSPKREHTREAAGDEQREVVDLRNELDGVRRELSELTERMDFAERLLAQQRQAERLAPPKT